MTLEIAWALVGVYLWSFERKDFLSLGLCSEILRSRNISKPISPSRIFNFKPGPSTIYIFLEHVPLPKLVFIRVVTLTNLKASVVRFEFLLFESDPVEWRSFDFSDSFWAAHASGVRRCGLSTVGGGFCLVRSEASVAGHVWIVDLITNTQFYHFSHAFEILKLLCLNWKSTLVELAWRVLSSHDLSLRLIIQRTRKPNLHPLAINFLHLRPARPSVHSASLTPLPRSNWGSSLKLRAISLPRNQPLWIFRVLTRVHRLPVLAHLRFGPRVLHFGRDFQRRHLF